MSYLFALLPWQYKIVNTFTGVKWDGKDSEQTLGNQFLELSHDSPFKCDIFKSFIFNIILDMGVNNFNTRNIAQNNQLLQKHFSRIFSLKLILLSVYLMVTLYDKMLESGLYTILIMMQFVFFAVFMIPFMIIWMVLLSPMWLLFLLNTNTKLPLYQTKK